VTTTVLKGALVIGGVGDEPIPDATITVVGDRIEHVSASNGSKSREGDIIIDLTGKVVIPGLINAHEHLDDRRSFGPWQERVTRPAPMLLLAATRAALLSLTEGITTVRDCGTRGENALYMKHAVELGVLVGPRIQCCISPIGQTGGYALPSTIPATGEVEVRRVTRELLYRGADFIKCMASSGSAGASAEGPTAVQMSTSELAVAFDEAHRIGRRATVHAHPPAAIRQAIDAGVDAIEHGNLLDQEVAGLMAEKGVFLVSTLSEHWVTAYEDYRRPRLQVERSRPIVQKAITNMGHAIQAGVKVAMGLDVLGNPVRELQMFIEAGMTPMQALRAATIVGADLMNRSGDLGSIEADKLADLVVLNSNPLDDIAAVGDVSQVMLGGKFIDVAGISSVIGDQLPGYLIDHGRLLAPEEYSSLAGSAQYPN